MRNPIIPKKSLLGVIIMLAIIVRIVLALHLGNDLETQEQKRVEDQVSYHLLAQSMLAGRGYSFEQEWYPFTPANTQTAHWSFLYPLYLAPIYSVFGIDPLAARIIQILISTTLSIWLLYQLAKRLFGESVGIITASLVTFYAYFIFYDATLMTEPFFITGILMMMVLTLQIVYGPTRFERNQPIDRPVHNASLWLWICIGIVFGFLALLRQTILLWLPFWMVWILFMCKRTGKFTGIIVSLILTILIILPWTIRNYQIYDNFLLLNSNAGYALYSSNHPHHGTKFIQNYAAEIPVDLKAAGFNEAQLNNALTLRGLQFILENPLRYALLTLDKFRIFFNFGFLPESDLSSNLMRVFSFGVYLPFYLYGLIHSFRSWQRYSLFYLFAAIFSSMHILTWASVRYRLPIDAVLMPFAAFAVLDLYHKVKIRLLNMRKSNQPGTQAANFRPE
jgi:4-amino-4-deoxy-L-arabinose transferase-like glycosyltransferase